jgi:hypothetical protein
MRRRADGAESPATADVPFDVIGVPFWRSLEASSAGSVAFPFIHTNDMPLFRAFPVSYEP